MYKFEEGTPVDQFYFNKFTEEANLFCQNNFIKMKET